MTRERMIDPYDLPPVDEDDDEEYEDEDYDFNEDEHLGG